jgi:hypothetical protein
MKFLFLLSCIILFASCGDKTFKRKFNKSAWGKKEDWDYPGRVAMVDDLVKHHKIKGLFYKQLVDSIGEPANWADSTVMAYELVTDFGSDIDPIYTKTLIIYLSKDSMAIGFKIIESKKN